MKTIKLALLIFLGMTSLVFAETDNSLASNPSTGALSGSINFSPEPTTVTQQTSSNSGLANGLSSGMVSNPNTIVDGSAQNAVSGLENKYNNASQQANAGQGAAIGAGAAMMGTGVPMLVSPIIPVMVAGAVLVSQAAMEFAQAGADQGASNSNLGNESNLTNPTNQISSQASAAEQAASMLGQNQQLLNLLNQQGVDPNSFIQGVANGSLNTPNAVLAALGQNPATPDQLAEASAIASGSMPSSNPLAELPHLGMSDSESSNAQDSAGGGSTSSSSSGSMPNYGNNPTTGSPTDVLASTLQQLKNGEPLTASQAALVNEAMQDGKLNLADANLVTQLFGVTSNELKEKDAAAKNMALMSLGITPVTPGARGQKGNNIFQLARQNYRSFKKWRAGNRVASNP